MRARYYNQSIGRLSTVDPFEGSIYDPPSLHRYLYANADPVNYFDPSGESGLTNLPQLAHNMSVMSILGKMASPLKIFLMQFKNRKMIRDFAIGFGTSIAGFIAADVWKDIEYGVELKERDFWDYASIGVLGGLQGVLAGMGGRYFQKMLGKNRCMTVALTRTLNLMLAQLAYISYNNLDVIRNDDIKEDILA